MSKHKKIRFMIHYVKPTAQLLFRIRVPKGGPTCRRQVVNPRHQTSQGQSVAKPETPLYYRPEAEDGCHHCVCSLHYPLICPEVAAEFKDIGVAGTRLSSLIAMFMGPTWGPPGADRTQVGPMLAPWALLSGFYFFFTRCLPIYVIFQTLIMALSPAVMDDI